MEPMNLLVVENGADWSQWPAATQLLGQAGVVLVQQSDETGAAFRARISARMRRVKTRAINAVLLLRTKRSPAAGVGNGRFLRELVASAKEGLRIFPSSVRGGVGNSASKASPRGSAKAAVPSPSRQSIRVSARHAAAAAHLAHARAQAEAELLQELVQLQSVAPTDTSSLISNGSPATGT
jgi:hypothetical protein